MSEQEAVPSISHRIPSVRLPWHVRCCRRLRPVLLYMWALIVGILASTIANLDTTTTDTPLSRLFIVHLALVFPIPVFSSFGLLAILTLVCSIGKGKPHTSGPVSLLKQNRMCFLTKLYNRYTDFLEQALQGIDQIPLTLHSAPDAVQNTTRARFHQANLLGQAVPDGTSLVQLYDQASGELLILGDPGSGKTMLLFRLAMALQQRAVQDASAPVPVVVNLSTWANARQPLQDWLIEEIIRTYDVPQAPLAQLLQEEQILPLLDGLDDVEESARAACIRSINTYHSQHLGPLVVCSRKDVYQATIKQTRLKLHAAIVIQPLTTSQVDAYLAQGGKPLAALRTLLKKKHELQRLSTTPLMLNILVVTYRGTSMRASSTQRSLLQQQVFTDYVQRQVMENEERYSLQSTYAWLGWLAYQMRVHNQTIFFLEELQPDWLPIKEQVLYRWSARLITGLIGLVFGGIFSFVIGGILNGIIGGLIWGLIFFWFFGRDLRIKPREVVSWSPVGVRFGFVFGFGFGVFFKTIFGLVLRVMNPLAFALTTPMFICWGILACGLSGKQLPKHDRRTPNEGIRRSAKLGLIVALLTNIFPGILSGLIFGGTYGLAIALFGVVIVGLNGGLLAMIHHYIVRFYLWRTHLFPWKATRFLDNVRSRTLLQRVGGGYSFIHRLLLDHFEDLYKQQLAPTQSTLPDALPASPPTTSL